MALDSPPPPRNFSPLFLRLAIASAGLVPFAWQVSVLLSVPPGLAAMSLGAVAVSSNRGWKRAGAILAIIVGSTPVIVTVLGLALLLPDLE
jgi:hypothetical protein